MKTFRLIGWTLILLGIGLCCFLIGWQVAHTLNIWHSGYKAQEFPSWWAYFWSVSKGAVFLGILVGILPASMGAYFLRRDQAKLRDISGTVSMVGLDSAASLKTREPWQ